MNENVKTATRAPVMEARGIRKAFGQVQALRGAVRLQVVLTCGGPASPAGPRTH
jgi:hypothetical protein